jgi:regulator of replication initiation timing
MFKKDMLESVGGFDEEFDMCEDWDLTIRLAANSSFYHIRKFTSEYNIWSRHNQSILDDELLLHYRKKLFAKHINKITPSILAKFIFNGYWVNLKYMEDRINCLESEISKMQKEADGLMEEKERICEEKQRLWEETQRLRDEKQKTENEFSQLENYMSANTIKVPRKMKSILKSLMKNRGAL